MRRRRPPSSRDNSIRFAETKEINDHSVLLSIANGGKTSQPSPTTYYEDEEKPFFLRFSTFFHLIVFTYSDDDENISEMWWCHHHQCKKNTFWLLFTNILARAQELPNLYLKLGLLKKTYEKFLLYITTYYSMWLILYVFFLKGSMPHYNFGNCSLLQIALSVIELITWRCKYDSFC